MKNSLYYLFAVPQYPRYMSLKTSISFDFSQTYLVDSWYWCMALNKTQSWVEGVTFCLTTSWSDSYYVPKKHSCVQKRHSFGNVFDTFLVVFFNYWINPPGNRIPWKAISILLVGDSKISVRCPKLRKLLCSWKFTLQRFYLQKTDYYYYFSCVSLTLLFCCPSFIHFLWSYSQLSKFSRIIAALWCKEIFWHQECLAICSCLGLNLHSQTFDIQPCIQWLMAKPE